MKQQIIQNEEMETLLGKIPNHICDLLKEENTENLLEIVLDMGRPLEARYLDKTKIFQEIEITELDLKHITNNLSEFGQDNRAGIERTLHRISAIRNRNGKIIGLTLRVGRAVFGAIRIIEDFITTNKNVLLLGRPGVGKTTMLREVARVLADDTKRRVIVVDTSSEIAGDGDIPHPGIGRARRMHVQTPIDQHAVMIEAVENHMPEAIIVDEIGTELDANAARTIAERGVQLVATAHGNTLENLIMNPTLSDLVGGVQSVTLGDLEARRRRTQKSVLERRAPPTFDVLVEIHGWDEVAIHPNVSDVVDKFLRGQKFFPQKRTIDNEGNVSTSPNTSETYETPLQTEGANSHDLDQELKRYRILPYGVNKGKLIQALRSSRAPIELVNQIENADMLVTTKNYYRRRTQALKRAENAGKPVYVLRKNTLPQIQQFVQALYRKQNHGNGIAEATHEAEMVATQIVDGEGSKDLSPQTSYVRRLQHKIAERYGIYSTSIGEEPNRYVRFSIQEFTNFRSVNSV